MTTLTAKLTPSLAKSVAKAADLLKLSHEEVAIEAVRQFVRAVAPVKRKAKVRRCQ